MNAAVMIVLVWLVSPILLLIWAVKEKSNCKKRDMLLRHLWEQKRITDLELRASGMKLPVQEKPPVLQIQQEQAEPVQEQVQQQPEELLSAAAERAKLIAESELTGTPLPPVSLEKPAAQQEVPAEAEPSSASAPETVTAPAAEFAPPPETVIVPAAESVPVPQTAPVPAQQVFYPAAPAKTFRFSPISILLSVGVVLIIVAGLIFVRSQWGTMTDGAKLLTLAAGSVLFFGSAAIAGRTLKLERTGTAFYTLGAVFLPISIWTAGFFKLLGSGISGASDAKLYVLSFGAFAVCACIAVKCFRQKSWGIASLCGITAAAWSAAIAVAQHIPYNVSESDRTLRFAGAMAAAAGYAVVLSFAARPLKKNLPDEIAVFLEPFAAVIVCITACFMPVLELVKDRDSVCMLVVFLMLAAFCSGMITDRFKDMNAMPMSFLAAYAFRFILAPLYWNKVLEKGMHIEPLFALVCMIVAAIWFLTIMFKVVPDSLKKGAVTAAYAASSVGVLTLTYGLLLNHMTSLVPAVVTVILVVITGIYAGREVRNPVRWLLAAEVFTVCSYIEGYLVWSHDTIFGVDIKKGSAEAYALLILCGMLLLCFAGFVLTKRWRSDVSDLLFPAACVFTSFLAVDSAAFDRTVSILSVAFALAGAVVFWLLTMEKREQKPIRFLYAALMPASAAFAAVLADEAFCKIQLQLNLLETVWGIVMLAAGIFTCCISKKDFNAPRRLMTALCLIPPAAAAAMNGENLRTLCAVCVVAAWIIWQILEKRGMVRSAAAAFGAGLFLAAETTVVFLSIHMYERAANFTEFMVASLWVLAVALISLAENKYAFVFPGSKSMCAVGRIAAPAAALFLSVILLIFFNDSGSQFCYIYTFGFAVVSWLCVKPKQMIMPCFSVGAFFFTAESVRQAVDTNGRAVLLLFIMCGLEVLFPYLGKVLREGDINSEQRRSWSLTVAGVIVPIWLTGIALSGDYGEETSRRLVFFIPILAAGFVLHFIPEAHTAEKRKSLLTVASALFMIAFWIQPFVDVEDTYFEGKLHLLPLIAFGIVIRKLYGEQTGSGFLFGIGIYSMLRLGIGAAASEEAADLLTVLGAGFGIFTGSFYVKQKKWFLLGGVSLLLTAVYMHMKLMNGAVWWVYLLVIGLLLLVIGAVNEMLRQRGDSLKDKAGRLWEEWRW